MLIPHPPERGTVAAEISDQGLGLRRHSGPLDVAANGADDDAGDILPVGQAVAPSLVEKQAKDVPLRRLQRLVVGEDDFEG